MRAALLRLGWLIPVLMLAANALAWLRYGTDFPFFDDWRAYATGDIRSLQPARLFQVVNNTLSPVGFALDALAQRWLDGNTIAYQLLSMLLVLGSLLWLQWKLLCWAVPHSLVRAVAFAFTVFMLQSSTYWGEQNLAYQQALPLVFLLAALYVILVSGWRLPALGVAVTGLGLLAGFSYISGAVSALVMGALLVALARLTRSSSFGASPAHSGGQPLWRARRHLGAVCLLLSGVLTTAMQFYATRVVGGMDRSEAFPVRWPTHPDFWAYLLGKVGRSFGAAFQNVTLEISFALVVAFGLVAVLLLFLKHIFTTGKSDPTVLRVASVCLPLAGAVAVYLGLVAFGRSGFRDASIQSLPDVFRFAYERFHFFWVTLLFPWIVAAGLSMGRSHPQDTASGTPQRSLMVFAGVLLVLGGGVAWVRGVFDVATYYEQGRQARASTIRCMSEQLGSGEPIMCPEFSLPGWTDWTPAYLHARAIGASFTKYFPVVPRTSPRWMWDGAPADQPGVRWHDAVAVQGDWRQGSADPQLLIEGGEAASYAQCRMLEVQLRLRTEKDSFAQVFYRPLGATSFSEAFSHTGTVLGRSDAEPVELRFLIESARGFEPVLRIDPVQGNARFRVESLRVGCGMQSP